MKGAIRHAARRATLRPRRRCAVDVGNVGEIEDQRPATLEGPSACFGEHVHVREIDFPANCHDVGRFILRQGAGKRFSGAHTPSLPPTGHCASAGSAPGATARARRTPDARAKAIRGLPATRQDRKDAVSRRPREHRRGILAAPAQALRNGAASPAGAAGPSREADDFASGGRGPGAQPMQILLEKRAAERRGAGRCGGWRGSVGWRGLRLCWERTTWRGGFTPRPSRRSC